MRIMSLNVWGGTLYDDLVPYLRASPPDVLCLQEVIETPASPRDWLTYRDGAHVLPQRANLFRDVAAALPDHAAIFCPAARGDLWDGDVPVRSHWGLATFVRRTLPIIAQRQEFVFGAFAPDGFGAHPRARNAHAIRIHDDATGRTVGIVQMHGLRDPSGKADTPARLAQAQRLAHMAARIVDPGDPLVVCGDFNVEPGGETFAVLAQIGLRDLVQSGGFAGTRTSHYLKPGRFADYMLVNAAVDVAGFDVVRAPEVSDHCPLLLVIR